MPSPFPGMDPYLEEPGLWPDVHHELISVAREKLNALLRPKYHVRVEERVYFADDQEIHDAYLEIIDTSLRQVVTVIEILSPTNKLAGSYVQKEYLRKRRDVMRLPSHLVEIDLLRMGEAIITRERLPPFEYLVQKSVVQKRPQAEAWPIQLRQPLPVISIPLRSGDPDVPLDLQAVLETAYERGAYDLAIDYHKDPVPPLSPELASWADELLKAKEAR